MSEIDSTRFEIIKEILMEFPALRLKVLKWLQETESFKNLQFFSVHGED